MEFFATSYGKGAVDGVGGTIKRVVYRRVMARKVVVNHASSFAKAASNVPGTKIKTVFVPLAEIEGEWQLLDTRWEQATTLKGTQTLHQVVAREYPYTLHYAHVAGASLRR